MQCRGLKKVLVTNFISFNISGLSDGRDKKSRTGNAYTHN
jgi:hypothetical protein